MLSTYHRYSVGLFRKTGAILFGCSCVVSDFIDLRKATLRMIPRDFIGYLDAVYPMYRADPVKLSAAIQSARAVGGIIRTALVSETDPETEYFIEFMEV